jgi:hypothetical protein
MLASARFPAQPELQEQENVKDHDDQDHPKQHSAGFPGRRKDSGILRIQFAVLSAFRDHGKIKSITERINKES